MKLTVDVMKALRSRDRVFELDVRFETLAETIVIYGASGAGKSITLQAIAGLIKPDRGLISFGDRVLYDSARRIDVPARDREIGYVFQDYALFPHMTVAQNIAAPLQSLFSRKLVPEDQARVDALLETFELSAMRHSYPSQLSGGQRQRTALGRALAARPKLLLLDEPFASLDTGLRQKMRAELLAMHEQFRIPMVMITHDEADAKMFGRELIVLNGGRVSTSTGEGAASSLGLGIPSLERLSPELEAR